MEVLPFCLNMDTGGPHQFTCLRCGNEFESMEFDLYCGTCIDQAIEAMEKHH